MRLGCVGAERAAAFEAKATALAGGRALLEALSLTPNEAGRHGLEINRDGRRRSAFELLAYPGVDLGRLAADLAGDCGGSRRKIGMQLEVDARYAAYVERQNGDVEALRRDEAARIPADFDYAGLPGLSTELRQKLGGGGRLRWRRRRQSTELRRRRCC